MKTILVTGSRGFIGRNLCLTLRRSGSYNVLEFDLPQSEGELAGLAGQADVVIHLAGVNRPKNELEFGEGNSDFTRRLCGMLSEAKRGAVLVLSSSIQAELDNPYGKSKKLAEDAVLEYQANSGAPVYIYRFPNVFGKWSRPNYNTVVATFCHNISRGLPVQISNRANPLRFVYIDDVVRELLEVAERQRHDMERQFYEVSPVLSTTLGDLHDLIVSFHEGRAKKMVPDLSDPLVKRLYSTYLSFLPTSEFASPVDLKTDERGWLFELVKSAKSGQIFVSRTKPGVTRGNHYHDTKVEKFCVVQGRGVIRFRHVLGGDVIEYPVDEDEIKVVDIPPGYTHSIENTGTGEMLTLFWANEIFDPQRPDTFFEKVVS